MARICWAAGIKRRTVVVENANLQEVAIDCISCRSEGKVGVSRIRLKNETEARAATGGSLVHSGDGLLDVGARPALDPLQPVVGKANELNLTPRCGPVVSGFVHLKTLGRVQLTLSEVASPDAGIPPLNHAEVTPRMTRITRMRNGS